MFCFTSIYAQHDINIKIVFLDNNATRERSLRFFKIRAFTIK